MDHTLSMNDAHAHAHTCTQCSPASRALVKESRTGVNVPRERSVRMPDRFGLIEGSEEEGKHEAAERGETLRLQLLGVGPRYVHCCWCVLVSITHKNT